MLIFSDYPLPCIEGNAYAYKILEINSYSHIMRFMNAIRYIRKEVFDLTQAEFAAIAGVTQATVSRWEGGVSPSLEEVRAIRNAAADRGVDLKDEWFFDPPNTPVAA